MPLPAILKRTAKQSPLIIWGGVDISSHLYCETPLKYTQHPDNRRDYLESILFDNALATKTPIIGVCRGAQLICAKLGGKLYQHSEGHDAGMRHPIKINNGLVFLVPSAHHQIMVPPGYYVDKNNKDKSWESIAQSNFPTKVWLDDEKTTVVDSVAEIIWWPKQKCLAIQTHPEWCSKHDPFLLWLNDFISSLGINYAF